MVKRRGKGKCAKGAARARVGALSGNKFKNMTPDELSEVAKKVTKNKKDADANLIEKELIKQPHSFIIHRGQVGKYVKSLEHDLRHIMEPNTAKSLKIRKNNNIKDFVVNGAVLGVTNMMVLTMGTNSVQLRMMRFSQGPTLSFKVKQYSISKHILSAQKRPLIHDKLFQKPPLVVMNGFQNQAKHLQLVQTFIQNMFPTLNIDTVNLKEVKRCLMVNYNEEDDTVDFRHYSLRVVASGLSKSSKKILNAERSSTKGIPDLSKYKDISDYFLNPGQLSDSEFEGEQQEVELPQDIHDRAGTVKGEKSNIRLCEIGPRITLELLKIQEGIDEGEVLYHRYVEKTSQEIAEIRKKAPLLKKNKKRLERDEQHRIIRRLTAAQEWKEKEEAEVKAIIEKAARQQAAASGQTEEIENQKEKDRELAMNRERELKRQSEEGDDSEQVYKRRKYEPGSGKHAGREGGFARRKNVSQPLDYSRKKKSY